MLNKYKILIEIKKNGSLSKTASIMGYTQSNISHMIKNMESECGFPLLIRNSYPIRLTPEAAAMLPYITKITDTEKELLSTLQEIKTSHYHTLHVGIPGSVQGKWIKDLTFKLREFDDKLKLSYTCAPLLELYASLSSGALDCCLLFGKIPSHFYSLPLLEIPVLLASPKNAAGIDKKLPVFTASEKLRYLCPDSALQDIIQKAYPEIKFPTLLSAYNDAAIVEMVKESLGFSLLPYTSLSTSSDSIMIRTPEIPLSINLGIAATSEKCDRSTVMNFMTLTKEYFYRIASSVKRGESSCAVVPLFRKNEYR